MIFAITHFDTFVDRANTMMKPDLYGENIYYEFLQFFTKYVDTSSTKVGVVNYGKKLKVFKDYQKLAMLFLLDRSIKNAAERLNIKN